MVGRRGGAGENRRLFSWWVVSLSPDTCSTEELPDLLGNLNTEFVYSRGRSMGIEHRFPGVMNLATNFFVQRQGGKIASALAVKRFTWMTPSATFAGAMLGMVWTTPSQRGRGLAKKNLLAARLAMLAEGRDFMVLWTTRPDIYSGSGWLAADHGLYGALETTGDQGVKEPTNRNVGVDLYRRDFAQIETIRERLLPRISREAGVALPIPFPATMLRTFVASQAYAIVGFNGDEAFVLDLDGDPLSMVTLWLRLQASARKIHVNVATNSMAERYLTALNVPLSCKPLAMWAPLSTRANDLDFSSIYIPFLDRI
ncbi:MAG: GNAT family N-acetyltransferase [Burkholderiales bacterium]